MSILTRIIDAVYGAVSPPLSMGELKLILAEKALENPEYLNWQTSIVDLMKLVGMDSSLTHREELAKELGYTGKMGGAAEMNEWLHAQVMSKLAAHGGHGS